MTSQENINPKLINNLVPVAQRAEVLSPWDFHLPVSGRVVYKLATNK